MQNKHKLKLFSQSGTTRSKYWRAKLEFSFPCIRKMNELKASI